MSKKRSSPDLYYAAKIFVVYLKTMRLPYTDYMVFIRGLRHILKFYGYWLPLSELSGKTMLQYADIHDPFDNNRTTRERGEVFWKFMFFLKKNQMIPAWTEPEPKY
jgi:hypothetical protein